MQAPKFIERHTAMDTQVSKVKTLSGRAGGYCVTRMTGLLRALQLWAGAGETN